MKDWTWHGVVDLVVFGHRSDSMTPEVFSNLIDSLILSDSVCKKARATRSRSQSLGQAMRA